jgi:hypothetical protein
MLWWWFLWNLKWHRAEMWTVYYVCKICDIHTGHTKTFWPDPTIKYFKNPSLRQLSTRLQYSWEKFSAVILEVNWGVLIMVCGCPNHIPIRIFWVFPVNFTQTWPCLSARDNFIHNPVKKENLTDHKMTPNSIHNCLKSTKIPVQMKMCWMWNCSVHYTKWKQL